jgi:hypothetical protein
MTEPQLDFGETAQPGEPPEPGTPAPRRRTLLLAAAAVAAAAALGVAAIYGPTAWQIMREKDVTLSTPDQAAGLTLDNSDQARGTADYLRTALAADLGLDNPIGAVYADGAASSRSVIIVGGTAVLRSPAKDLDRAFQLLADSTSRVEGVHDVPAGNLGGVVRCGATSGGEGSMTVCGWADHGSLAIAMFPGRPVDDSAGLFITLRSAIQHRK